MSDSPLDGGSGWPTSAYAIVPRQATPQTQQVPAQPSANTTAQQPVADPAPHAPQPPHTAAPEAAETAPHRRRRLAVLVIGLVVVIVAVVGGVLATRDTGGTGDSPGGNRAVTGPVVPTGAAPVTTAAGVAGGPSADASGSPVPGTSGTPDPSSAASSPASQAPVTDVLRAGTVRLAVLAGQSDETFDFDSGIKQAAGADVAAGTLGLTAVGGAAFAPILQEPTLAGCGAIPAAQWSDRILLSALLPTAKVCVRTGEQRFGWFSPRPGEAVVGGQLYTTYLDFTVWRKAGD